MGANENAIKEAVNKELRSSLQAGVEEDQRFGGSPYSSPGPVGLSNVSLSKVEERDSMEGTQFYRVEGRADASVVYQPKPGLKLSAVPLRMPVRFRGWVKETDGEYTVTGLRGSGPSKPETAESRSPSTFETSMPSSGDVEEAERIVSAVAPDLLTYDGNDAEYAKRQEDAYLTAPDSPAPPPTLRDRSNPYFTDPFDQSQTTPGKILLARVLYGIDSDICTDERPFRSIRPVGTFRPERINNNAGEQPGGSVKGPAQVITVTGSMRVAVDPRPRRGVLGSRVCPDPVKLPVQAKLTRGGTEGRFKIALMEVRERVYAASPREAGLPDAPGG
jgi:hypothetical protein